MDDFGMPNVLPYSLRLRLQPTSIGRVTRGANYFAGVNMAKAVLTQKIDISAAASAIDAGNVSFDASAYLGGDSDDNAQMIVTFLGASGNTLSALTLGPVLHSDRRQEPARYLRRQIGLVPAGARSANVELDLIRASGTANDALGDNLSLVLNSGGPAKALFNTNIIVNGTGDAPTGSTGSDFALDTPGWVRSANFTIGPYAAKDDLSPTDPGPADRGANYFYRGPSNELSTAMQDLRGRDADRHRQGHLQLQRLGGRLQQPERQHDSQRRIPQLVERGARQRSVGTGQFGGSRRQ